MERLQKLGLCLSYTVKEKLLGHIGVHFKLVKAVKEGRTLRGTGDNLDMRILAHDMTSEHQKRPSLFRNEFHSEQTGIQP